MSRYGRSEKEKVEYHQQQIKEESEWRKGHAQCKNEHTVDTMWASPGEKCVRCGETIIPFSNTVFIGAWKGGEYADNLRTETGAK